MIEIIKIKFSIPKDGQFENSPQNIFNFTEIGITKNPDKTRKICKIPVNWQNTGIPKNTRKPGRVFVRGQIQVLKFPGFLSGVKSVIFRFENSGFFPGCPGPGTRPGSGAYPGFLILGGYPPPKIRKNRLHG